MILVVDDDVAFGTALEKIFRYDGLESVSTSSGTEALSLLHLRKPRLIILDLHMPLMDGLTLLQAVRTDVSFKNVPIIVYTSDFSAQMHKKVLAAGAQDYIVKGTIGWSSLVDRVKELLGKGGPPLRLVQ